MFDGETTDIGDRTDRQKDWRSFKVTVLQCGFIQNLVHVSAKPSHLRNHPQSLLARPVSDSGEREWERVGLPEILITSRCLSSTFLEFIGLAFAIFHSKFELLILEKGKREGSLLKSTSLLLFTLASQLRPTPESLRPSWLNRSDESPPFTLSFSSPVMPLLTGIYHYRCLTLPLLSELSTVTNGVFVLWKRELAPP
ncbi:hypothetical protein DNTS_025384 [Danionella cerebrum]|uniref:Uncharacterized protein n=1 Tax=Danionella cerebrum TaxID=2873325 RepID=A0A553QGZ0_9TELE|nr:hypothetical protein DNTS_025384 [Danionella translucida]